MENRPWIWLGLVAMVAVATACSEDRYAGGNGGAGDDIGVARFALTAVPADVACIKVTANGTKTKKQNFDVTPGTATVLTMGGLPTGTVTFTADAFSVPCAMVTSTTAPSWVADPITTDVAAGVVTSLSLIMRQTGTVDISIDFAPPADPSGIAGGATHTCAVNAGAAFCWGGNAAGQLGLGHQLDIGDDAGEIEGLPPIDFGFGTTVTGVVAGDNHSCALVDTAATSPTGASVTSMRCWGAGATGQLGLGNPNQVGSQPGDMGAGMPAPDLGPGRTPVGITAGANHTCALTSVGGLVTAGGVVCFGNNAQGQLGGPVPDAGGSLPFEEDLLAAGGDARGDEPGEMGVNLPLVKLGTGRSPRKVVAGKNHTCALLDNASVKCWGDNSKGQLGQGDMIGRGKSDADMGDALKPVNVGTGRSVKGIAAGGDTTCALLDNASVKCWGDNSKGQLGQGDTVNRGKAPGEMGDSLPVVDLGTGRGVKDVNVGGDTVCAKLDNDDTKCWGGNTKGQLGKGDTIDRGKAPGEMGDSLTKIDVGAGKVPRKTVPSKGPTTCVEITKTAADPPTKLPIKCFGENTKGQLGVGDKADRGDQPGEMGDNLKEVKLPVPGGGGGTLNNGVPCTAASQCLSAFCEQGVCCGTSCTGGCRSCNFTQPGTCQAIPAGQDPLNQCAAAGGCGQDGTCDGAGGCRLAVAGTSCGTGVCTADVLTPGACNGAGVCTASGVPVGCAPYTCNNMGTACAVSCTTTAQCAAPSVCVSGICRRFGACDINGSFFAPVEVATLPNADGFTLSFDELTAYVSSNAVGGGTGGGYDIFVTTRASATSPFGPLSPVAGINTTADERSPWLSENGLHLYFTQATAGTSDIMIASRASVTSPFGTPVLVGGINAGGTSLESDPFLTSAEQAIYFTTNINATVDLFFAPRIGPDTFGTPVAIPVVNAQVTEDSHPVISRDGLRLYFKARRSASTGDTDGDIWIAHRASTSSDFLPAQDVLEINQSGIDFPVALSGDECTLYLGSNRDTGLGGTEVFRIYQATRAFPEPH